MIKKAIDRQKVIKALELCKYDPDPGQTVKYLHSCIHCPYWNDGVIPECSVMYTDAIDLLKEQAERIKTLEHQLETITKWRANAGANNVPLKW